MKVKVENEVNFISLSSEDGLLRGGMESQANHFTWEWPTTTKDAYTLFTVIKGFAQSLLDLDELEDSALATLALDLADQAIERLCLEHND